MSLSKLDLGPMKFFTDNRGLCCAIGLYDIVLEGTICIAGAYKQSWENDADNPWNLLIGPQVDPLLGYLQNNFDPSYPGSQFAGQVFDPGSDGMPPLGVKNIWTWAQLYNENDGQGNPTQITLINGQVEVDGAAIEQQYDTLVQNVDRNTILRLTTLPRVNWLYPLMVRFYKTYLATVPVLPNPGAQPDPTLPPNVKGAYQSSYTLASGSALLAEVSFDAGGNIQISDGVIPAT